MVSSPIVVDLAHILAPEQALYTRRLRSVTGFDEIGTRLPLHEMACGHLFVITQSRSTLCFTGHLFYSIYTRSISASRTEPVASGCLSSR
jgi:hypothetical protein